jgi:RNA polymerase sigma factor (sigma-70 family)
LEFARSEPGNETRGEETGVRRKPAKPKPGELPKAPPRRVRSDTDVFPPGSDDLRPPEAETDRDEKPDAIAEARERERLVQETLRQLPPDHQRVLHLRLVEGRTWEETAAAMGRPVSATKQLFRAALALLRQKLRRALDLPEEERQR